MIPKHRCQKRPYLTGVTFFPKHIIFGYAAVSWLGGVTVQHVLERLFDLKGDQKVTWLKSFLVCRSPVEQIKTPEQWFKGPWLVVFFLRDEILPRFIEILLNHYKDPGEILMNQSVFKNFMSWELLNVTVAHLGVWNGHGTTQSPAFPGLLRSWRLQDLFQAHFDGANLPTPNAATGSAKRRNEFCDQQEPKQQATSKTVFWIPWIPILASCWSCWTCTPGRPHWPYFCFCSEIRRVHDLQMEGSSWCTCVHVSCTRILTISPSCWKFSASNRRQPQMCWVEKI